MEYVIVGGGVYGCAVAWWLARQGAEVCLLESGMIAGGASGGLGRRGVRANGRDLAELPLMSLAYDRWPTLHELIGAPTGYERCGHLLLVEREKDVAPAQSQQWVQEQHGILTRFLAKEVLKEMEPNLSDRIRAALFCPLDGVADHGMTTVNWAQAAGRLGVEIREKCRAVSFEHESGSVGAVITGEGQRIPVSRSLILLCNSSAADLLLNQFKIQLPVWNVLPQVVFTEPVEPMPIGHLVGHAHRVLSIKPNLDGRVMISGGWRGRWNSANGRGQTRPDQVEGNVAEARAVYPVLEDVEISEAHADRLESISYDGIPIIDQVPGFDNALFGAGWSGHGWAIAPTVTELIAQWAISDKRPPMLAPFSYERFRA